MCLYHLLPDSPALNSEGQSTEQYYPTRYHYIPKGTKFNTNPRTGVGSPKIRATYIDIYLLNLHVTLHFFRCFYVSPPQLDFNDLLNSSVTVNHKAELSSLPV